MPLLLTVFAGLIAPLTAMAQFSIADANGQDGVPSFGSNTVVNLGAALDADPGEWRTRASSSQGVYDPEEWAVIYRYSSVTIPNNVSVSFTNHPSGAPVVWLVSGDVTISGTLDLRGGNGQTGSSNTVALLSTPGPGGFSGGRGGRPGVPASSGFGPGGGAMLTAGNGAAGSYATVGGEPASNTAGATYGNPGIQPLIGGSGGAGNNFTGGHGGGAGGGAILIAATGTITVNGTINVNGGERVGGAGGSGGAIRLVASTVAGSGALTAQGGSGSHAGGLGRIRVEAKTNNLAGTGTPPYSFLLLQDEQQAVLNPNPPSIRPVTLGGVAIPPEPLAGATPDMQLSQSGTALLVLEGRNIPTNSTVRVRVVPLIGPPTEFVTNSAASGDETSSTWQVNINVAGGISTIQARAVLP